MPPRSKKQKTAVEEPVYVHDQRFIKKPVIGTNYVFNATGLVSAGFSGGQPKGGVDEGPVNMLRAGIEAQLTALDWTVERASLDCSSPKSSPVMNAGAVPSQGKIKNAQEVSRVCKSVSDAVKAQALAGHLPLTLGGDHSLAMGTISGTAAVYPGLGVIWVDAHAGILN
jgi:arginase